MLKKIPNKIGLFYTFLFSAGCSTILDGRPLQLFSPSSHIDNLRVTLDDFDNLHGNVGIRIVLRHDYLFPIPEHGHRQIHGLFHILALDAAYHNGAFIEHFRTFSRCADQYGRKMQHGALFTQRTAV